MQIWLASSPNTVLAGVSFGTFSDDDIRKMHYNTDARQETKAIKCGSQWQYVDIVFQSLSPVNT